MELKTFFAQDLSGNVISSPTVNVYLPDTTTSVTGLQTATGAALSNPFTGTSTGQITLAAPDGTYDLAIAGGGRAITMRVRFVDITEDRVAAAAASAADALDSADAAAASAADAQAAQVAAEAARDIGFANAKGAATIAEARALVADTETFIVYADGAATFTAHRRTSSTTQVELGTYPSSAYVEAKAVEQVGPAGAVISTGKDYSGWGRVWGDSYGRVAAGIKPDGTFYIKQISLPSATIAELITNTITQGATVIAETGRTADYSKVLLDSYGRISEATKHSGGKVIAKLFDNQGRNVYTRLQDAIDTADSALTLAVSGGASAFKQAMVSARAAHGFWPRPTMTTPPTLTLTGGSPAAPMGFSLRVWNSTTSWRTLGGFTSQFGGNPFLQWRNISPTGNASGFSSNLGCAVEFTHTGTEFYIYLRGNGAGVRVIVDNALANSNRLLTSSDGEGWLLRVDFTAIGSATRKIRIESAGMQFGGVYIKAGETIAKPTSADPPKVCVLGTSITEGGETGQPMGGYAWWLARQLGIDAYACGVGGAGIINPGTSRVKQLDRSNDYTVGDFVLCIDENGVNDTAYTYQAFLDEYRRNLDAWFTAHPASPWIGWGPFWPNSAPTADVYKIRDAKQQAIAEYPMAAFIDTLDIGPFVPSVMQTEYINTDNTHPKYLGAQHIGARLFNDVDTIIRTRF